jgi:methylated-DNA-[protein]-cysteine S-methyltransferase
MVPELKEVYTASFPSPLGLLTAASDGTHITGLWMKGQKYEKYGLPVQTQDGNELSVIIQLKQLLEDYFCGKPIDFSGIPLKTQGTPFQKDVWKALLDIPYGTTITYGELARRIGRETASRAVGAAVGRNPISILIPCHRVVGRNQSLTGYAGGIERKKYLLKLENIGTE